MWYASPKTGRSEAVYTAPTAAGCEKALARLRELLRELNEAGEGFHVVEHILLRPLDEPGYVAYLSDGLQHRLTAARPEPTRSESQRRFSVYLESLATQREQYAVTSTEDGYAIVLRDDRDQAVAFQEGFAAEETAEAAIGELVDFIRRSGQDAQRFVHTGTARQPSPQRGGDPYSFRVTVAVPNWPARFQNEEFQKLFESLVRQYVPAHLSVHFLWLDLPAMQRFDTLYHRWLLARQAGPANEPALDRYAAELLHAIEEFSPGKATS